MKKNITDNNEWTFEKLDFFSKEIEKIAREELELDPYPIQAQIISADQMIDSYASHALPVHYEHWSIGKKHIIESNNYEKGKSGLAFEIIANTNPSIAYLMETNTNVVQVLVLAHCMGHSQYFKHNYMYKQWSQADFIVEYMKFAKDYIKQCENKYGLEAVEKTLDAAHALQYNGIDKYKRTNKTSKQLKEQTLARQKYNQTSYNSLWDNIFSTKNKLDSIKTPNKLKELNAQYKSQILPRPEENLLYFLEKNSPVLQTWQREILRIVRKISQYWWPAMSDKVTNEGFACFTHYYIMNRLYEKGFLTDGEMIEFFSNHANVILQTFPDFRTEDEKKRDRARGKAEPYAYNGINVYALGFAMMQDVKRICENPTEEDKKWFPDLIGKNWKEVIIHDIVPNYRDESFIRQFLSPKVIRDFKLFAIQSDEENPNYYDVLDIHNQEGYKNVRKILADSYDINTKLANIQVTDVDFTGDRKLTLTHYTINDQLLNDDVLNVLHYVKELWGFDVTLNTVNRQNETLENFDTEN